MKELEKFNPDDLTEVKYIYLIIFNIVVSNSFKVNLTNTHFVLL